MKYQYRHATQEDLLQLQILGLDAYGQFKQILTAPNWDRLHRFLMDEDTYSDLLAGSKCYVCEIDGEVIGMAFLVPSGNPTDIFPADWSYIRMVGVHTRHGGKGIGKTLTQMCVDQATAAGEKVIALHTSEFMDAARHIYEQMGFRRVKNLEPRLGKTYWLYAMDL